MLFRLYSSAPLDSGNPIDPGNQVSKDGTGVTITPPSLPGFMVGNWKCTELLQASPGLSIDPQDTYAQISQKEDGSYTLQTSELSLHYNDGSHSSAFLRLTVTGKISGTVQPGENQEPCFIVTTSSSPLISIDHFALNVNGMNMDVTWLANFFGARLVEIFHFGAMQGVSVQKKGKKLIFKAPTSKATGQTVLEPMGPKPPQIIDLSSNDADLRAFYPSKNDKTGIIKLTAQVPYRTSTAKFLWEIVPGDSGLAGQVTIESPTELETEIHAMSAGLVTLKFSVDDPDYDADYPAEPQTLQLSVPQFYYLTQDSTAPFLQSADKDLFWVMKARAEDVLKTVNVRMVWRMGPMGENLPKFLEIKKDGAISAHFTNTPNPDGSTDAGNTHYEINFDKGTFHPKHDPTISLFPAVWITDELMDQVPFWKQVLIRDTEKNTVTSAYPTLYHTAFGRVLGRTTAHEILHSLGLNHSLQDGDIMWSGEGQPVGSTTVKMKRRTGYILSNDPEMYPSTPPPVTPSPDNPATYLDDPLVCLEKIFDEEQKLLDTFVPVPPALT